MSKWYASCLVLRLEKEKELEIWKKLHVVELKAQLPILSSHDDKFAAESVRVAGGQKTNVSSV